jgi:hypothetical protein
MRISTDPDDVGYHAHANYVRVFLEGAERLNVVTADERARFAITIRLDEFGQPVKDKKTGKTLHDKFYGAVRIDCADWLRIAMESSSNEEGDTIGAAVLGMIQTP